MCGQRKSAGCVAHQKSLSSSQTEGKTFLLSQDKVWEGGGLWNQEVAL